MNKLSQKEKIIYELESKMKKDKRLKNLKIYANVWDFGYISTSITVEGVKTMKQINYIESKYNLILNRETLNTGSLTFNRNLA
jgi:hypothetical protein